VIKVTVWALPAAVAVAVAPGGAAAAGLVAGPGSAIAGETPVTAIRAAPRTIRPALEGGWEIKEDPFHTSLGVISEVYHRGIWSH
jgi:hypothetical protein